MRLAFRFAAAGLAALVSAACSGASDSTTSPTTPQPLLGATWRLTLIDGRPALAGVSVTALFDDANRVSGSAGCNRYFGSAQVTGDQLAMSGMASTRMYCAADGVMEQEQAYLDALTKATSYRIAGTQLQLGPAPGTVTLVYDLE